MEKILDLQNQSSLAKLLATENITVTHKTGLKTAYFDVKHRVLGLPVWKDKGKVVYDMLVGHEVSHALYTPANAMEEFVEEHGRKNFDVLNIIEDIRIERLIKNKYAGMPRIFKGAYTQLVQDDFFGVADKDIAEMNFLDRLNLRGKIGDLVDIPLNEKEEELYNKCYAAETFEEVTNLYHEVLGYAKEEAKEKEAEKPKAQVPNPDADGEEQEQEEDSSPIGSDEGSDDNEDFSNSSSFDDNSNVEDDGTESHSLTSNITDETFEKAMEEAMDEMLEASYKNDDDNQTVSLDGASDASDTHGKDVILEPTTTKAFEDNMVEDFDEDDMWVQTHVALWPTKKTINKHIIGYKQVMADRKGIESFYPESYYDEADRQDEISRLLERGLEFKKKTNKKVSVLVREFERRKAAYQYSRAQESRKGSLDVNKLHKYKYDDQIFQSVMHLADAKSHGMIFFIDYSGSMGNVLQDVLEHTLNLVHFCRKVGIPFKVYSFTSNYALDDLDESQSEMEFDMTNLVLAELFSSEMSKSEYEKAFQMVTYQILNSNRFSFSQQGISKWEHLGGTPLDATAIAAHHIIDDFRKKNNVQKLNVIFLTDGDSHSCRPNYARGSKLVTNIAGKQYEIERMSAGTTQQYMKLLRDIKNVNLIGFFLPESKSTGNSHLNRMARNSSNNAYKLAGEWMKKYRKEKFFHRSECFGYNSYFLLSSDIEIKDEEFDFSSSEGKTLTDNRGEQSKLARQFAKHNVANRTNRIIMTKFAEIIA